MSRSQSCCVATEQPCHTFPVHGPGQVTARAGRFVSTWNVWRGCAAITVNTCAMKSSGICSWKRSDMELTTTMRGLFQVAGLERSWGRSLTFTAALLAVHGNVDQPRVSEIRSA